MPRARLVIRVCFVVPCLCFPPADFGIGVKPRWKLTISALAASVTRPGFGSLA